MSRTSQRSTFRVIAAGVIPVYRALAVPRWRGTENFPDTGGFVVAANHLTELDPIVVAHAVYRAGIMPRFLAKESLFRIPVVGRLLSRIGQVPVYRGTTRAKDSLDAAFTELDSGGAIIVYPEGTITRDPGMWPMRGRTGAARLALQAGVPVVPVAHWVTRRSSTATPRATAPRTRSRPSACTASWGRPCTRRTSSRAGWRTPATPPRKSWRTPPPSSWLPWPSCSVSCAASPHLGS